MTVAAGARSSSAGNGTTTSFTATFRATSTSGIGVAVVTDSTLAVDVKTLNVDYTVTLDSSSVPTIVFGSAPASGETVLIYPLPAYLQPNDITPGGALYGSTVEASDDNILSLIQGLQDQINQCVRFPQNEKAITALTSLAAHIGEYLYFNPTTGQPESKDIFDLEMVSNPQNDDIVQRKSNTWVPRTLAQLWADLQNILPDSLRFSADTDTGFTRSTADTVQVTVGGSAAAQYDANGQTLPLQPAFSAYLSADDADVTGNGTAYSVVFDTEIYDRNADYDIATGVFTAPVTGLYDFSGSIRLLQAGSATSVVVELVTSNRTYLVAEYAGGAVDISTNLSVPWAVNGADLDAADTAFVRVTVTGEGGDTTDLDGDAAPVTWFSGRLVA